MCCNNRYITNSFNNNGNNFDTATLGSLGYSLPTTLRYGSSYVPNQTFRTVYSPEQRFTIWNYVS